MLQEIFSDHSQNVPDSDLDQQSLADICVRTNDFIGSLFDKIAAVIAIALAIFFSGAGVPSTQIRWIEPYTVWALQHNSSEIITGDFPFTGWFAIVSAVLSIALLLTIAMAWMKRSQL